MHRWSIGFLKSFVFVIIILMIAKGEQNEKIQSNNYLGYEKPGSTPEIFAPNFISTQYAEFAGTFSPDFMEFYFTRRGPFPNGLAQIMVTKNVEGTWSEPIVVDFSSNNYEFEPFITPDGQRLYFGSKRSPDGVSPAGIMHQWYLEKVDSGWSDPILLGSPFFERMVMYPTVSNDGTIFFTGEDGIYFSELINDVYQEPVKMGPEINFLPLTAHSFIAPDEGYLIFDGQPRGEVKTDIYISYKKRNGSWTKGKPLSKEINSGESQAIASVSPDGECLFFTRNSDIYWVDAGIIDQMKLIPTISITPDSGLVPLSVKVTTDIATVPDSILSFKWDLNNDGTIDSKEKDPVFTYDSPGTYSIRLVVFTSSDSASHIFEDAVNVLDSSTDIKPTDENKKVGFGLFQNYPNPFNPTTSITYEVPKTSNVRLEVYNSIGQLVATLANGYKIAGEYTITWDGKDFASGIYFAGLTTEEYSSSIKMMLVK